MLYRFYLKRNYNKSLKDTFYNQRCSLKETNEHNDLVENARQRDKGCATEVRWIYPSKSLNRQ